MHFLLIGILLGMGAAIPIGPVNLEIIRRNIRFGTPYGIVLGLGACSADVTYLVLLCLGALSLLQYPMILKSFGLVGSLVLLWFAYSAFTANPADSRKPSPTPSLIRYSLEGYLITMINPFTILFWASISSQISMIALANHFNSIFLTGLGVVIGTVGWVVVLNLALHMTRHRLTEKAIKMLNYSGGVILVGFAVRGILKAIGISIN